MQISNLKLQKFLWFVAVSGLYLFGGASIAHAATLTWVMGTDYSLNRSGLNSAIKDARSHFSSKPDDTIIVHFPAGTHDIGGSTTPGINLSGGMSPGPDGRFIIEGEGMENTTLVFSDTEADMIYGKNAHRVTCRDMHWTRAQYTVSQGTVVDVNLAANPSYVDLEIHDGFPMPDQLIRWSSPQGLYLRRYTASLTDPIIITDENNTQVRWATNSYAVATNAEGIVTWRMLREDAGEFTHYQIGEYVGVKSKHTGNSYFLTYCDDVAFERIKWTHSTRGTTRSESHNIRFSDCRFVRAPAINGQTPCMSSPGGGPQFGGGTDVAGTNNVVERCYIEAPGDDCIGIFSIDGMRIEDCEMRDGFARGIYIDTDPGHPGASNVRIKNTVISHGYVLGAGDRVGDTNGAPATPTGLGLSTNGDTITLTWDANTEPDLHFYNIKRQMDGVWYTYAVTTSNSYEDSWAYAGHDYAYYVTAEDFYDNESGASEIVGSNEPPVVGLLSISPLGSAVVISWQAGASGTHSLQVKQAMSDVSWSDVTNLVPGVETTLSVTTTATSAESFYRVSAE